MGILKLQGQIMIRNSFPHTAQHIVLLTYKLMAGEQLTFGGNRQVFIAGAAARKPLIQAGALFQFHIEMKEVEGLAE